MPLDYSKWDALELSDDSDIEVHPNVDKRSFIRAKQSQIHMERQRRKHQIETLKYERQVNDGLAKRISMVLGALKAHAAEAEGGARNPGEVAFQAVMESAAAMDPKDDRPPPRPEGVHFEEPELPTYSKMMATLLDQVNEKMEERKVTPEERYGAMMAEIEAHLNKVKGLQEELLKKLAELEKEEGRKITSESIHTGFDSSFINKSAAPEGSSSHGVELLNPNYQAAESQKSSTPSSSGKGGDDDVDPDLEPSPLDKQFLTLPQTEHQKLASFLIAHPEMLGEKHTDVMLMQAFNTQIAGDEEGARRAVHHAVLTQFCRQLGRDGVALFFRRLAQKGHQARDLFYKEVQEKYATIRERAKAIAASSGEAEGEGVEQIQLHAVEPGTVINIRIPPADAQDEQGKQARAIFDAFKPDVKKALETGKLDEVNKMLGRLDVAEAEDLVGKFGEAGILSLEEQIIDATTEEGRAQLKQIEQEAAATTSESVEQHFDDPE